jgi:glycosyltransferase involved in cell wall biosynthesis
MSSQQFAKSSAPAVSVIIPAYQTAPYIRQALESVWAQSFQDFEVVVVNDGSPDTPELECALQPYLGKIAYIKQHNGGPSSARNTGIRNSVAPLIAMLDSDDYWEPDYLATQTQFFGEDPSVDAVYPNAFLLGDPRTAGKTYMEVFRSEGEVTFRGLVSGECNVMGPGIMVRRASIEQAGLYDPEISHGEDLDLWLRFLKHGGRIVYHRRPLYNLRSRPDSLSKQSLKMWTSVLKVLEKNERLFQLTAEEVAAVDAARRRLKAGLQLERGRNSFFEGDVESAIRDIGAANEYYQRSKLRIVLALMRTAPGVLKRIAQLRRRLSS